MSVESDTAELLEVFDRDYSRFATDTAPPGGTLLFSARLEPVGQAHLEVREEAQGRSLLRSRRALAGSERPVAAAYRAILRELFAALDGFVILHAGVVAADGAALLLAGPPGIGKTTLALALAESGLAFFSDDFCPIDRETGLAHPFPRSPWVVGPGEDPPGGVRPRKRPAPPPSVDLPDSAFQPCRPGWVLVLDAGEPPDPFHSLEIDIDVEARPALVRDLARLGSELEVGPGQLTDTALRLQYPSRVGLAPEVRATLARHAMAIREVFRIDAVRPDFSRAPLLSPIPVHEAAFSLLDDLKGPGRGGPSPGGGPGSAAGILMELAGLLGSAACYRLTVGQICAMRETLLGLVGRRVRPDGRP